MKSQQLGQRSVSRRSILSGGAKLGAAGLLAGQVAMLEQLAWAPNRLALAASTNLPDINFLVPPRYRAFPLVELEG